MKHPLPAIASGLVVLALGASGRAEPGPGARGPGPRGMDREDDEAQTLFGSGSSVGGYGGPEIRSTRMLDRSAALVGGQGGVVFGHALLLGGAGYGLVNRIDLPGAAYGPPRRLSFGYGGPRAVWVLMPRSVVHATFGALIGGGAIAWEEDTGGYEIDDGEVEPDRRSHHDGIFVFEPQVEVEVNVSPMVRLAGVGSYRFVNGIRADALSDSDFTSLSLGAVVKIGVF